MASLWTPAMPRHSPVCASQRFSELDELPEAIRKPSGEKATELTHQILWPLSTCRHSPVCASQILSVLSLLPETIREPSGEKATELTSLVWPLSTARH